jgi:long-chain acyl-CoA synthetase
MADETGPTMAETHAALTAPPSMFEIEEADVFGHRIRVWKYAPASLRVILGEPGRGDVPFIVYEDEVLTFEITSRRCALAALLVERYGVQKGDRCDRHAVSEWSIAFWATTTIGRSSCRSMPGGRRRGLTTACGSGSGRVRR